MANSTADAGVVGRSASVVHAFLREQVLTVLAPVYLFRHRRATTDTARDLADLPTCGPTQAIDLQPTGIRRS